MRYKTKTHPEYPEIEQDQLNADTPINKPISQVFSPDWEYDMHQLWENPEVHESIITDELKYHRYATRKSIAVALADYVRHKSGNISSEDFNNTYKFYRSLQEAIYAICPQELQQEVRQYVLGEFGMKEGKWGIMLYETYAADYALWSRIQNKLLEFTKPYFTVLSCEIGNGPQQLVIKLKQ